MAIKTFDSKVPRTILSLVFVWGFRILSKTKDNGNRLQSFDDNNEDEATAKLITKNDKRPFHRKVWFWS